MSNKEIRINVRANQQTVDDLRITARLRGMTVSSLVNWLVIKAIREEKAVAPESFYGLRRDDPSRTDKKAPRHKDQEGWRDSLRKARGIWKDRDDLPDFDRLRREWSRNVWKEHE